MTNLAKDDWVESQLLVPRSSHGHARRKRNEEQTALIPLIQIYERNEMNNKLNTITQRYGEQHHISSEQ
jgi:hypothetical protein